MLQFVRRTWLPAVLFILPILLVTLVQGQGTPLLLGVVALYVIIVVSVVWWLATSRHASLSIARGTTAGALCGAVLALLPAVAVTIGFTVEQLPDDVADRELKSHVTTVLVSATAISVWLGSLIGALTALLQRRPSNQMA